MYALLWVMNAVLCILCCTSKTSTWGWAVSCVCVHLPTIGVYAVWLDALLPLQLPCNTNRRLQPATIYYAYIFTCIYIHICVQIIYQEKSIVVNKISFSSHNIQHVSVSTCVCWGVSAALTLDVYLLHLIDLCDRLSELLCKLPELFSARGAETHQLLLLWGKRAQHGDAMGVVWWDNNNNNKVSKRKRNYFQHDFDFKIGYRFFEIFCCWSFKLQFNFTKWC